jgi:hypothetical protein
MGMFRIVAKGVMLFVAGFAAAALLFLARANVPQAQALENTESTEIPCYQQGPWFASSSIEGDVVPDQFDVIYTLPPCLQNAGYEIIGAQLIDFDQFTVGYQHKSIRR